MIKRYAVKSFQFGFCVVVFCNMYIIRKEITTKMRNLPMIEKVECHSPPPLTSKAVTVVPIQTTTTTHTENATSRPDVTTHKDTRTMRPKATYFKVPNIFNSSCWDSRCIISKDVNWTMVIFVKSAAGNTRARKHLRNTWASLSYINRGRFFTVFVVGRTEGKTQAKLDEEHSRFGDILQANVLDDYRYIAVKTLSGMQWASENLPDDYYYSSADDDIMINMNGAQEKLEAFQYSVNEEKWSHFPIICMLSCKRGRKPLRDTKSKYYTPYEEYNSTHWPDFCLGGFYSTSVKVITKLWEVSRREKLVRMDDVWITGVLRNKASITKEFVKEVKPSVAKHYWSYSNTNRIEKAKSDWFKMSNNYKGKTTCSCDDSI